MQQAKKTLICECYIIPKIEDILTELHRAKYYSKFDLTEGYHQMKLDPNSRHIATFHTCQGLYQYKKLIYGISSAYKSFQKQKEIIISDYPKAKNISNNILICGNTLEEHNSNLKKVFQQILVSGLKISLKK